MAVVRRGHTIRKALKHEPTKEQALVRGSHDSIVTSLVMNIAIYLLGCPSISVRQ